MYQLRPYSSAAEKARVFLVEGKIEWDNRPVVIVDIDGTTADLSHRLHLIEGKPKDYDQFFLEVCNDGPIEVVVKWVRELAKSYTVVFVSGRPADKAGDATVEWLRQHRIPFTWVFMRWSGDYRKDDIVKEEILDELCA